MLIDLFEIKINKIKQCITENKFHSTSGCKARHLASPLSYNLPHIETLSILS